MQVNGLTHTNSYLQLPAPDTAWSIDLYTVSLRKEVYGGGSYIVKLFIVAILHWI